MHAYSFSMRSHSSTPLNTGFIGTPLSAMDLPSPPFADATPIKWSQDSGHSASFALDWFADESKLQGACTKTAVAFRQRSKTWSAPLSEAGREDGSLGALTAAAAAAAAAAPSQGLQGPGSSGHPFFGAAGPAGAAGAAAAAATPKGQEAGNVDVEMHDGLPSWVRDFGA